MPACSYYPYSLQSHFEKLPCDFRKASDEYNLARRGHVRRSIRPKPCGYTVGGRCFTLAFFGPPGSQMGPGFFLEEEKLSARKLIFAALAVCSAVRTLAGPILTTIQDVIYNADGTPYNGFAVITWTPFVAGDTSQIATQSVTVNITGGNLMVQLVPTTNAIPAGYYSVTFTSTGNAQFTETWAVPPSTVPLRVQAVLISPGTLPSPLITGG